MRINTGIGTIFWTGSPLRLIEKKANTETQTEDKIVTFSQLTVHPVSLRHSSLFVC